MTGLEWMTVEEACDLLRVSDDNAEVIEQHAASIPYYVETVCGLPAEQIASGECGELARQLCRFLLQLFFDPDGTDAAKLERVIASLTRAVRALAVAEA